MEINVRRLCDPFFSLASDVSREIEDDAARRQDAARFLIEQTAQIDEATRREAFRIPETVIDPIEEARLSYNGMVNVLEDVINYKTRPATIILYRSGRGRPRPSHPAVTLGLAEYSPRLPEYPERPNGHILNLTDKGQELANKYLEKLGKPTIAEQYAQNRAWLD